MSNLIDKVITQLNIDKANLKGCTSEEINRLEKHYNVNFPLSYRQFLEVMGHDTDFLFQGTDILYPEVFDFRDSAKSLVQVWQSKTNFTLENSHFVFAMHQGYVIFYFDIFKGDDPPVFMWIEGDEEAVKLNDSFTSFLIEKGEEAKKYRA